MAAQHLDVGIDGAVLAVIVIVPDLLQDLFAAQCNALVADQKNQQVKLLRGQRRLLPGHLYAVAGRVDGQIAEGIAPGGLGGLGHRAGQHGLDTGDQLPRGERLDDIVIGTALQPGQLVVFLTAGGQHDHGGHDLAGAHLPQAGHAVHKRHHNVQNYQINAALAQHAQRGGAVAGLLTGKARVLQMLADEVPDARLIIHDQNFSHRNALLICYVYNSTIQCKSGRIVKKNKIFIKMFAYMRLLPYTFTEVHPFCKTCCNLPLYAVQ